MAKNYNKQQQLNNLLATYNLISTSTIRFPTRSINRTVSEIDNIFIDISNIGKYTICPFVNGLSDHEIQIIWPQNIFTQKKLNETKIIQKFDKYFINDFKIKLSCQN